MSRVRATACSIKTSGLDSRNPGAAGGFKQEMNVVMLIFHLLGQNGDNVLTISRGREHGLEEVRVILWAREVYPKICFSREKEVGSRI